jgi:hypothetical protein
MGDCGFFGAHERSNRQEQGRIIVPLRNSFFIEIYDIGDLLAA